MRGKKEEFLPFIGRAEAYLNVLETIIGKTREFRQLTGLARKCGEIPQSFVLAEDEILAFERKLTDEANDYRQWIGGLGARMQEMEHMESLMEEGLHLARGVLAAASRGAAA